MQTKQVEQSLQQLCFLLNLSGVLIHAAGLFGGAMIPRISWADQAGLSAGLRSAFTENLCYFSPGEREPGEGERRPAEGGEAAERGSQVPRICAEQPRASVHGPHPPEPRTPVPSSPRQLPPAHHHTTLPALTCPTTERRCAANRRLTSTSSETDWWHVPESSHDRSYLTDQPVTVQNPSCNRQNVFILSLFLLLLISISGTYCE